MITVKENTIYIPDNISLDEMANYLVNNCLEGEFKIMIYGSEENTNFGR